MNWLRRWKLKNSCGNHCGLHRKTYQNSIGSGPAATSSNPKNARLESDSFKRTREKITVITTLSLSIGTTALARYNTVHDFIRREPERAEKAASSRKRTKAAQAQADESLLAARKALRTKPAQAQKLPAYLAFSDAALADMAAKQPRGVADFLRVTERCAID